MSNPYVVGSGLRGLTALVTGGSRGIGRGIASAISTQGANVVLTSRDEQAAISAASAIGKSVFGVQCDVTSSDSIATCVARAKVSLRDFGDLTLSRNINVHCQKTV
jgi:3-oxoacyl-[acyl-carrier protein] reductase